MSKSKSLATRFSVLFLLSMSVGWGGTALAARRCSCVAPRGEYSATSLPQDSLPAWTPAVSANSSLGAANGILTIDTQRDAQAVAYFGRSWGALNSEGTTVDARMRLEGYTGDTTLGGAAISVEDDKNAEVLLIRPDGIQLYASKLFYAMNTMDRYHTYRIVTAGQDIQVLVDGNLAIDGTGMFGRNWWAASNVILFGDESYYASSRSSWDYVRYYNCTWEAQYSGDELPQASSPSWSVFQNGTASDLASDEGALKLDTLTSVDTLAYFARNWGALSSQATSVEARMKLDAYTGDTRLGGAGIWVETDTRAEVLLIRPDSIGLYGSGLSYPLDTMGSFHSYCIDTSGSDIMVYVDGQLAINGQGRFNPLSGAEYNWVGFGDGSYYASSQSHWDFFQYNRR